jgi:hypothetical protein
MEGNVKTEKAKKEKSIFRLQSPWTYRSVVFVERELQGFTLECTVVKPAR